MRTAQLTKEYNSLKGNKIMSLYDFITTCLNIEIEKLEDGLSTWTESSKKIYSDSYKSKVKELNSLKSELENHKNV